MLVSCWSGFSWPSGLRPAALAELHCATSIHTLSNRARTSRSSIFIVAHCSVTCKVRFEWSTRASKHTRLLSPNCECYGRHPGNILTGVNCSSTSQEHREYKGYNIKPYVSSAGGNPLQSADCMSRHQMAPHARKWPLHPQRLFPGTYGNLLRYMPFKHRFLAQQWLGRSGLAQKPYYDPYFEPGIGTLCGTMKRP